MESDQNSDQNTDQNSDQNTDQKLEISWLHLETLNQETYKIN